MGPSGNKLKCWYCGTQERCTKDHFFPKSKGGVFMVWACTLCQGYKGDLMPTAWARRLADDKRFTPETRERMRTAIFTVLAQITEANWRQYSKHLEHMKVFIEMNSKRPVVKKINLPPDN